MFRLATFLVAFFALVCSAFAAPAAPIEKRVTHSGHATFYYPGLGNCGWTNTDDDLIVAMSKDFYDNNDGSNCGQKLQITWNGQTETATMVDSCPGCDYGDLDMSPALFKKFADESVGVLEGITWNFLAKTDSD